ncbi:DEAD/DEAH box helicase [Candidatus Micrarchaeota archaeon]|nr:DEAD/DEAH box helicase [Candidatus Micrarchaeota archaeon]
MSIRFEDLRLAPELMKAINDAGFEHPTPIQEHAIPLLLQGSDLIGQAQTGTGKTAAFALSILQSLVPERKIQALILVPTRELALQVVAEFRELGKYCPHRVLAVYGGEDIQRQIGPLRDGVDIVVATPGRIMDHLERRTIKLDHVKMVVLDEADRMLDMGFIDDVKDILKHTPKNKQTALFSATMPSTIIDLARTNMVQPEVVKTSEDKTTAENIRQHYVAVDGKDKLAAICTILSERKPSLTIIFARTKRGADNLHFALRDKGFDNVCLHGDLTQSRRERSMDAFRSGHKAILVATDIAARGLDVDDIELVVNYNLPDEPEVYVHRIGRTARAGKKGDAISFITNVMEKRELMQMVTRSQSTIEELVLKIDPEFRKFTPRQHHGEEGDRLERHGGHGGSRGGPSGHSRGYRGSSGGGYGGGRSGGRPSYGAPRSHGGTSHGGGRPGFRRTGFGHGQSTR